MSTMILSGTKKTYTKNEILNKLISDMELTCRSINGINAAGIKTVADLLNWSEQELLKTPNLGKKSIMEIKERLKIYNLFLKDSKTEEVLDIDNSSVVELDLSAWCLSRLKSVNIETIGNLIQYNSNELLKIPSFGRKCLIAIELSLKKHNKALSGHPGILNLPGFKNVSKKQTNVFNNASLNIKSSIIVALKVEATNISTLSLDEQIEKLTIINKLIKFLD